MRLAVRDYGSAGTADHTVVLLHGLCLTQASWAIQSASWCVDGATPYESSPTTTVATAIRPAPQCTPTGPALDRPVEPQGLVLIATAAGRIAERGIGRLLATPATGMLFELVRRMPRRATDQGIQALVRPVCDALIRYSGHSTAEQNALAAVAAAAIRTTSLTTAAGFLPSLKRYDQYHTLAA